MKVNLRPFNAILTAVAAGAGVLVLLGYLVPDPLLLALRLQLVAWAVLLSAVAVLIGAYSLIRAHAAKFMSFKTGGSYSLIAVLGFVAAVLAGLLSPFIGTPGGASASTFILEYVILAGGTALAGLLLFTLVVSAGRLLGRKLSVISVAFLITLVIALLGLSPASALLPDLPLREVYAWIASVPATAGARGLLIGISLGVIATGLRVVMAIDRPYGD
jgi:hypothetical protein